MKGVQDWLREIKKFTRLHFPKPKKFITRCKLWIISKQKNYIKTKWYRVIM